MFKRMIAFCGRLASGEGESYPPRRMTPAEVARQHWDHQVDVAVVGFGGAGAAAAIEARDSGADVLAVDRFRSAFGGPGPTCRPHTRKAFRARSSSTPAPDPRLEAETQSAVRRER